LGRGPAAPPPTNLLKGGGGQGGCPSSKAAPLLLLYKVEPKGSKTNITSLSLFSTYVVRLHQYHRLRSMLWTAERMDFQRRDQAFDLSSSRRSSSRLGGIRLAVGIAAFRIFTELFRFNAGEICLHVDLSCRLDLFFIFIDVPGLFA
jgi:hypothetical protein